MTENIILLTYRQKYYRRNKEKILAQGRLWRAKNLDKYQAAQKRFREKHRDERNAKNRERYTTDSRWEKQLRERFGIEPETYWKMHGEQKGLCAICGKPQFVGIKLDVDHDHLTQQVRALLCRHCNTGIGLLKDSIELVQKALNYLVKHSEKA